MVEREEGEMKGEGREGEVEDSSKKRDGLKHEAKKVFIRSALPSGVRETVKPDDIAGRLWKELVREW